MSIGTLLDVYKEATMSKGLGEKETEAEKVCVHACMGVCMYTKKQP